VVIRMKKINKRDMVCFWDKYKGLKGSMVAKARKFNKLGLIDRLAGYNWQVNPLPGNSRSYIVIIDHGEFSCQCQRSSTGNKGCSHIMAVELWMEINGQKKGYTPKILKNTSSGNQISYGTGA